MTEATLGFRIDSSQAAPAARELDKLTAAGKKAEQQAAKLGASFKTSGVQAKDLLENTNLSATARARLTEQLKKQEGATATVAKASDGLSVAQQKVLGDYQALITKTSLLNSGRGKEAAIYSALRKAGTTADTAYGKSVATVAGNLYDLEKQQNKTEGSSSRLANTLTRRFVVGYLVSQIRGLVSSIASLNSELAKTGDIGRFTGVGGQQIQGLQSSAAIFGIESGKFLDDFLAFSRQIPLAKVGVGDLAALFRKNHLEIKDAGDALLKLADLVKNAEEESAKFSVVQQAGIQPTREIVKFLEQGSVAIKKQIAEARKLTDEQLNQAEIVEKNWNKIWDNVTRFAKGALVDSVEKLKEPVTIDVSLSPAAQNWVDTVKGWLTQGGSRAAGNRTLPLPPPFVVPPAQTLGSDAATSKFPLAPVAPITKDWATIKAAAEAAMSAEQQRLSILSQTATVEEQVHAVELAINQARLSNPLLKISKEEQDRLAALTRERALGIDTLRASTDSLNVEAATLGMSAGAAATYTAVQTKINEERRKGNELLPQELADLQRQAQLLGQATQRLDDLRAAQDSALGGLQTFRNELRNGASAWQAFQKAGLDALNRLADRMMDKAFLNLFSNLFGSFGGGVLPGGAPLGQGGIGSRMPVSASSYIHPPYYDMAPRPSLSPPMGGGAWGSKGLIVNVHPTAGQTADVKQNSDGSIDVVMRMVDQKFKAFDKTLPSRVHQISQDPRAR